MPFMTRKSMFTLAVLFGVAGLAIGGFVWSGMYNIGADDPHMRPTYTMLGMMRERSVMRHARGIKVPDLRDPALIKQGAGNYASMCTGCHLAPGMAGTELSKGLYPVPPNFSKIKPLNPAHAFWVTKHGIKASGMPAWGLSMEDDYIWGMVAFLQQLPKLDAASYQAMVASSGGHAHGGGETQPVGKMPMDESAPHGHPAGTPAHQDKAADPHQGMDMGDKADDQGKPDAHPPGTPPDHHQPTAPGKSSAKPAATVEHRHADGTVESHPAPQPPAGR